MIRNKVIRFGSNVDTDQIIGAKYLRLENISDMVKYTFEFNENFVGYFKPGYLLAGDDNFGCGSSREQAPAVLKQIGVSAIIAKSFARIFYRNSINLGIPLITCPDFDIENLDELQINLDKGIVENCTNHKTFPFEPLPAFMQEILNAGGIVRHRELSRR